jgi:REP element-mobilizing transposase RayT
MSEPVAYFLTFSTYGTWLHGRDPGSVDRTHSAYGTPLLPPNAEVESEQSMKMRQGEYSLDEARREVVLSTIREVASHRRWRIWAVHVRSNHVHVVLTAPCKPEKVMSDFKAWASRRLREKFDESADRDRWTQHGSTRYVWSNEQLDQKIHYVLDEQGAAMSVYDGRCDSSEPEA